MSKKQGKLKTLRSLLALALVAGLGMGATRMDYLQMRNFWENLAQTPNACPDEYDYFPEGGLRIFYCHAQNLFDLGQAQKLVGMRAFRKGPHSEEILNLNASNDFGHYNPAFVKALGEAVIPQDPQFIALTQPIYNDYMRDLARIFFVTYQKLEAHPAYLNQEANIYAKRLAEDSLPEYHLEKYFFFMNPKYFAYENNDDYFYRHHFDGGWNGNVVKTCVGFWIRRHLDGTKSAFYSNLKQLLKAYDHDFYITNRKG